MKKCAPLLAGLLLGVSSCLISCETDKYELQITPQGNAYERTLTVAHYSDEKPAVVSPEKIKQLAPLYAKHDVGPDFSHVFRGVFEGVTPNDVGGSGSYHRWETTMGTAWLYMERFRGQDDQAAHLQARLEAANTLADLLSGWLKECVNGHEGSDKLGAFLDSHLRQDMANLTVYAWTFQKSAEVTSAKEEQVMAEFTLRFSQYLIDRGYFRPGEAAQVARLAYATAANGDTAYTLKTVQRLLARQMGIPDETPIPTALAFLNDADSAGRSFSSYVLRSAFYQSQLAEWKKQQASQPAGANGAAGEASNEPPDPMDAVDSLAWDVVFGNANWITSSSDSLKVKLCLPVEPLYTNGNWDAQSKQAVWSTIFGSGPALPAFAYATWVEPNSNYQTQLFGKIVLRDDHLFGYCLWRSGLTESEGAEWDAFIDGLTPGEDLLDKLHFRFSYEPASQPTAEPETQPASQPGGEPESQPTSQPASYAEIALDLIRDGLNEATTQPAEEPAPPEEEK